MGNTQNKGLMAQSVPNFTAPQSTQEMELQGKQ